MEGIIYKFTNRINGKVYIGQTIKEYQRYQAHKHCYGDSLLHRAINKYGFENFDYDVIERLDEELLDEREIFWISYYKSNNNKFGYNLTDGGEGSRGRKLTEQHKQKLIDGRKNTPVSVETKMKLSVIMTGRIRSEEHCKHLSESLKGRAATNKGKPMSDKQKKKISETLKGRPLSEETKKKISESHKGRPLSEEHKCKISESLRRNNI